MPLLDRAAMIVAYPAREWPAIARESTALEPLFLGYALPLAAIGPVCGVLRLSLFGVAGARGAYHVPILTAVIEGLLSLALALVAVYLLGQLVNTLSRPFSGEPDFEQALKLVTYSYTPMWLAGVLLLLPQFLILRVFSSLIGLYAVYLLYLGLPPLLKIPRENALGFAVVVAIAAIFLGLIFDFGISALRLGFGLRG